MKEIENLALNPRTISKIFIEIIEDLSQSLTLFTGEVRKM